MVKICAYNYPKENEDKYNHYYKNYNYELHDFQKWTVEGIATGNHMLICCPTGSGKSFGAEFAIDYFCSKGKKVIYTSPIKSLSNQKFNDFTLKYPNVKVGIVTGDISCNPSADVIVMTTEILLNKLYQINSKGQQPKSSVSFEMNLETELACVIFDELHMINDQDRGSVWENSIMMLPKHVQMVGLSATLDNPEKFSYWFENKGETNAVIEKEVYLTQKKVRTVPLIHYSFITATQGVFKTIKDKATQEEIKSVIDNPLIIQDAKNKLYDENFTKINKTLELFEKNKIYIKRAHAINQVTKYLTENEMTPAICYVFSIRQIEQCAKELTTNLQEFDTKVPYIARRECDKILRDKFVNCEEYFRLPEYLNLVSLLEKGIATHHSKMLPVLREIVEIFFARGYIKILFATESVAIGLNLPVKSCIFTDIYKHDGTNLRTLYAHEYTQAAGRAGRLGLDSVGHVIHLNNIFRDVEMVNYKSMMSGKPQTLTSKFKLSYNLLLNLIDIGDINLVNFAKKSMIKNELDYEIQSISNRISALEIDVSNSTNNISNLRTPIDIIKEHIELQKTVKQLVNKKRKEAERRIQTIRDNNKYIDQDQISYLNLAKKTDELNALNSEHSSLSNYFETDISKILNLLLNTGFTKMESISEPNNIVTLTQLGTISSQIREIHCLAFAKLYETGILTHLSTKQLVVLFSCFTNIKVQDTIKDINPNTEDSKITNIINEIEKIYDFYRDYELTHYMNAGADYEMHYDIIEFAEKWCDCNSEEECKMIISELEEKKEIFLGEFVKAILKINNIACEFEKIAELTNNMEFLSKLKEIPHLTLKFVITNQSLYV